MLSSSQPRIAALKAERNQVTRQVSALLVKPVAYREMSRRGGFFDFLDTKILSHFESEEEDMWSSDYQAVYAHMSEHAKLNDYITSLRDDLESIDEDRDEIVAVTSRLLGNWLIRHVETFDRDFEDHLRKQPPERAGAQSPAPGVEVARGPVSGLSGAQLDSAGLADPAPLELDVLRTLIDDVGRHQWHRQLKNALVALSYQVAEAAEDGGHLVRGMENLEPRLAPAIARLADQWCTIRREIEGLRREMDGLDNMVISRRALAVWNKMRSATDVEHEILGEAYWRDVGTAG